VRKKFYLSAGKYSLELGPSTKVMGIVNITPDSFSQDGLLRKGKKADALSYAKKLINDGADMIDIGGESTRPGAQSISAQEEIKRVMPTLKALAKQCRVPVSIDTYKPEVAQQALDGGAVIVNTIMGAHPPQELLRMVKNYDAAIVLMHMRGTPRTMQKSIRYKNLIGEIIASLRKSVEKCLEMGIKSDKIILDPGIGFGKTLEHNLEIINRLQTFTKLNKPLLIGTSRKSFIGKILNKDIPNRLMGTAATVCASIMNGAHIVRVHDCKAMKEVAVMTDAILNERAQL